MNNISADLLKRAKDSHKIVNLWLDDNISCFSPIKENDKQKHNFRFKALAELCLYIHLCEKIDFCEKPTSKTVAALREIVISPSFLNLLLARPVDTINGIVCILPFHDTDIYHIILDYYKNICQPFNNEMLPFDILSHVYVYDETTLFDNTTAEIELNALSLSALGMPPNGITSSRLEAYPFTHTVFYATRFGRKLVELNDETAWMIERTLDIETAKAYNRHNIDVALELVLSRILLFKRITSSDYLILITAMELVEESGFLVAPPQKTEDLFVVENERQWSKNYHSMLVFGILIGTILSKSIDIDVRISPFISGEGVKNIALKLDSIGAIYAAVESGNLPIAALLYSRLKELPLESRPSASSLEYFENYARQVYQIFSASDSESTMFFGEGINVWSMTFEEFSKIMKVFKK